MSLSLWKNLLNASSSGARVCTQQCLVPAQRKGGVAMIASTFVSPQPRSAAVQKSCEATYKEGAQTSQRPDRRGCHRVRDTATSWTMSTRAVCASLHLPYVMPKRGSDTFIIGGLAVPCRALPCPAGSRQAGRHGWPPRQPPPLPPTAALL